MATIGLMRKKSLLPIDELNVLKEYLEKVNNGEVENEKDDPLWLEDTIEDLLVMAYVYGTDAANEDLSTELEPDLDEMDKSINKKIADKTWQERLKEENTVAEIMRIADTESHRIYNEAQLNAALRSGLPVIKTWKTMKDLLVRDSHDILEGVSVKLDERFYSGDDSALLPGGFERPENNINCRCELMFSIDKQEKKRGSEDET